MFKFVALITVWENKVNFALIKTEKFNKSSSFLKSMYIQDTC